MTVRENIAYVPSLSRSWSRRETGERVSQLLRTVGMDDTMAGRYPHELSGAVDEITRRSLQEEIAGLHAELKITVIFVTHDINEAMRLGTRMLVMDAGRAVQLDTPEAIRLSPANGFVQALLFDRKA